jgi:hypothetical protein
VARRSKPAAGAVPTEAARLLALAPPRFTSERDELARALAARGDAAGAAAVKRLRRPVGLAWLLNRLALDHADEVGRLLAAGEALVVGQRRALAGGGAAALREAEVEVREHTRALRAAAAAGAAGDGRALDPGASARLELLLRVAATGSPELRERLRHGRFEREPAVGSDDLAGFGIVAGAPGAAPPPGAGERSKPAARARGHATAAPPAAAPARAPRPDARQERARAERERAERERAKRERKAREAARSAAARGLARAERAATAAREAAELAERRAADSRARADRADAEVERLRNELRALGSGPDDPAGTVGASARR